MNEASGAPLPHFALEQSRRVAVPVIGAAARPGKSDAAIHGAFDAAYGLPPEGAEADRGG